MKSINVTLTKTYALRLSVSSCYTIAMKIYVTHSSGFDYQNELYRPLRESDLNNQHEIALPHEFSTDQFNSKEYMKQCDLIVAEASFPSTGQGIELGWANLYEIPIVCVHKQGAKLSSSIKGISDVFLEYGDSQEMIQKLTVYLSTFQKK